MKPIVRFGLAMFVSASLPAAAKTGANVVKIDTRCFEMSLPAGFKQTVRKPDAQAWYGTWGWEKHGVKVHVRCKTYDTAPFNQVLDKSISYLQRLGLTGWKQKTRDIKKDGARRVAKLEGTGRLPIRDVKTGKMTPVEHRIIRLYRRFPKRKFQINIAVSGPQSATAWIDYTLSVVTNTFDPIDDAEIAKLQKTAKNKKPK